VAKKALYQPSQTTCTTPVAVTWIDGSYWVRPCGQGHTYVGPFQVRPPFGDACTTIGT